MKDKLKKIQSNNSGLIRKIFFFDDLIFPKAAVVLYWGFLTIALLSTLGSALGMLFNGSILGFISAIIGGIIGIFFLRIWFEFMLVIFKINHNLQRLADAKLGKEAHSIFEPELPKKAADTDSSSDKTDDDIFNSQL